MPFALSLVDAFGDRALSGRYRDQESDPHRVMTMAGKALRDMSAQPIRDALAKASLHKTMPLFIADEKRIVGVSATFVCRRRSGPAKLAASIAPCSPSFFKSALVFRRRPL